MARLFVYDSQAATDAGGAAINMSLVNGTYKRSKAVRLYGAVDGPIQDIGWEMLFEGAQAVAAPITLYWFMEFMNDRPQRTLPSARVAQGVNPNFNWCREQLEYAPGTLVGGSTVASRVYHYDVRREVILADGTTYFAAASPPAAGSYSRELYFPVSVHAYWARLALTTDGLPGTGNYRLRIWAVVGGQDQQVAQQDQTLPYAAEL